MLGKVLSPQFVIWVLPLGALAFAWRMHALALAVLAALVLTQIEFPAHYFDVVAREPFALVLVAVRDLVLLAVLVLSVRALRRRGSSCSILVARPSPSASISTPFSHGPRRRSRSARWSA